MGSQSEDMGNGFFHHGVAMPISNHRGTVATVDGEGRDVVLLWVMDHRGCYALLMIDAETGKTDQVPLPFPVGDSPFASVLSTRNRFYTHFNSHFAEFDPVQRAFTFHHKTVPQMAMSMTEDDAGVIWSATYPNSAVASYNPGTGEFRDYGNLYDQNWAQYPRSIAADDQGWVYFGVGSTASQIVVLDPKSGKAVPVLPESDRGKSHAHVYRDMDGKVYGISVPGSGDDWYEFHGGKWKRIGKHEVQNPKPIIASSQGLFHREFPGGRRLERCDLVERVLVTEDPKTGTRREVPFDYTSEGAHIMGVATAPDGTASGGTAFPMRFFSYNPKKDQWIRRPALGQWNTVARQGDRFFVGAYTHGLLEEWDPSREWVLTERGKTGCNPELVYECHETINRPHDLLAHPDGRWVIMAGTPGYGHTGGGLLIWDRKARQGRLLTHLDLWPEQSPLSLAPLAGGRLLVGTTTSAGTGGEKKAPEAELFLLEIETGKVEWHQVVFPGAQGYTDLSPAPGGAIYGFVDRKRFFVFDPDRREIAHQEEMGEAFGSIVSQQGTRAFVPGPRGETYVIFGKGIARIDEKTHRIRMLAESPLRIAGGGDFLDGRIYFYCGSHLYSYEVPR